MKIGSFEVNEPLPELDNATALAMLSPWVDVGSVGTMALTLLESYLHARPLGQLAVPGEFYDFTRYRPLMRMAQGNREVEIPNSFIKYVQRQGEGDFLFFHLLEPHANGEAFSESIFKVMQQVGARRYCLIGSMYDTVPHTRPLIVSGNGAGRLEAEMRKMDVRSSDYEGPTTIVIMVGQRAQAANMESMNLIVHLPQYARLEKDYNGLLRILELVGALFNFPMQMVDLRRMAAKQYEEVNAAMEKDPQLKEAIKQLEEYYEARMGKNAGEVQLSPEIEKFLREATNHFEPG